jgi:phosphate ABC transporter phosphate-binding protein
MPPRPLRRWLLAASVVLIGVLGISAPGCKGGKGTVSLSGRGATFVETAMADWSDVYKGEHPVQISYTGTGSTDGIQSLTNKTVDFGCSDAPMTKEQLATAKEAGGEVLHIPLVVGAVVPAYNLEGLDKPLNFSGPLLADIFLGKVKKWNDPAIKAANPEANLPDRDIAVVVRAEGSGTSNIFTEYLSKVSEEFRTKVGASTKPKWPAGFQAQQGTAGVAGFIERTAGSLGYVELTYVLGNPKIKYGAVTNKAGKPVLANAAASTAAAAAMLGVTQTAEPYALHPLTYSLTDADGPDSYPICGLSYAILYKKRYAPLPDDLVQRIGARLNEVEFTP